MRKSKYQYPVRFTTNELMGLLTFLITSGFSMAAMIPVPSSRYLIASLTKLQATELLLYPANRDYNFLLAGSS